MIKTFASRAQLVSVIAGYVCCFTSLLPFPIGLGFAIAGLVLGIIAITKGSIGHGIAIIVLSLTLSCLGFLYFAVQI